MFDRIHEEYGIFGIWSYASEKASGNFLPSREPWLLAYTAGTKKTPTRGVLVYPLGLEPRLDGVGVNRKH